MPSSSRSRTRLETLTIVVFGAAAAIGTIALVWRPMKLLPLLEVRRLSMSRVKAIESSGNDPAVHLPLPLAGADHRRGQSNPMVVPPPVIPQALPSQPQSPKVAGLPSEAPLFTDLAAAHWVYPMLSELVSQNLVMGFPDGSFRPDQSMTRAEFSAQLSRLFDLSLNQEIQPFNDVMVQHWAAADIQRAIQMGFLTGYPDDLFFPDQTITRIQVLTALARGLNLKSSSSSQAVLRYYEDQDQVPDWAVRPLVAATEAGLVVNYPDLAQLNPNRPANRAEVIAMLYRALVYIGHLEEEVSSSHWVKAEPMPH